STGSAMVTLNCVPMVLPDSSRDGGPPQDASTRVATMNRQRVRATGAGARLELVAEPHSDRLRARRPEIVLRVRVGRVAAVARAVVPELVEQVFDIEACTPDIGPVADREVGLVDADHGLVELR